MCCSARWCRSLDEPGLHLLWFKLGWKAPLVNWLGRCHVLDMRLDQEYLRSQPVNSEEGAPMGIGIWYEMFISDPVAYLFKNADPRGSLAANVSNSTVRCLSNLKLADMMENRHAMSQTVRAEVSPKSHEWGYQLGSVYIRKVHFRDAGMIKQIEEKVVNRLRQVTSAIKQDGANQVSIITSTAERQAAIEFAKAAAMRPRIVGAGLQEIARDPDISRAMFDILESAEDHRRRGGHHARSQRQRIVEAVGCDRGRREWENTTTNPRLNRIARRVAGRCKLKVEGCRLKVAGLPPHAHSTFNLQLLPSPRAAY